MTKTHHFYACLALQFLSHGQCLVLGSFHNFPFSRTFIIDAAKVQDAMDNDPVQFSFIVVAGKLFGIGAYRIKADKEIAAQAVAFAIVKSDDVGIIIMLKILPVYFENFLVRAKI